MTADACLEAFGLTPGDKHLPAIRDLLAQEAQFERDGRGDEREEDLALLCAVQLFSRGRLDDVPRIWAAKSAGFDLACYLDVQLLCGAGLDETKAYLAMRGDAAAQDALEYIGKCEATGDFEGFDPAAYLEGYRRYFRVAG